MLPRLTAEDMIVTQLQPRGITDARVLEAMRRVPREQFVRTEDIPRAYDDCALPTADGQTISQPYVVAYMSQLLDCVANQRVLELGTGSGYQSAILAQMGLQVVTIERHESLQTAAKERLQRLGLDRNIQFVTGDGSLGCAAHAPFDRILVTAGSPHLPQPLKDQTADPGRIVIPIGPLNNQVMCIYQKQSSEWHVKHDIPVRFVPLIGKAAWQETLPE